MKPDRPRYCECGNTLKPTQTKYCSVKCKGRYATPTKTSYFGYALAPNLSERVGTGLQVYIDSNKDAGSVAHINADGRRR